MITRRVFLGGCTAALGLPLRAHAAAAATEELVARAMTGIDPTRFIDAHNHVVGVGHGGSGCTVHPSMMDGFRNPLKWIRFKAYARASGVDDMSAIDQQYMRTTQRGEQCAGNACGAAANDNHIVANR